ncbi:MAG: hypothetical protein NTW19_05380 [Planctomycetota bacterium]|nr:hypothetical protein [Planctomycetota bacterium]
MYTSPDRHNGQATYTFADGHARAHTLTETLNPTDWKWGLKMYSSPDKFKVWTSTAMTTAVQ